MLAKIICWARGHKRGKLVTDMTGQPENARVFRCPRCKRLTRYKVKT